MIATLLFLAAAASAERADTTLTLGNRPTVVAFLGADQGEIMYSADWARLLTEFKPELEAARPTLLGLQVVVREVYSPAIVFRANDLEWSLGPTPASLLAGYYLWSPTGPRFLCRGTMKADELIQTVLDFLEQVREREDGEITRCERAGP
jgi:hypothetical protein